jgi:periplasmic protein TonB
LSTASTPVFDAILNRQPAWQRLSTSTLAVFGVYIILLTIAIAFGKNTEPPKTRIPAKLVVTLFDAPKVAEVRQLGLMGGENMGGTGGSEGTGPVIKAPEQRTARPTPTAKAKVQAESKAVPNEKPRDDTGAGVQEKPQDKPVPVSPAQVESAAPAVGAAAAAATSPSGGAPQGVGGGQGGAGQGTGSGGGGFGQGNGMGTRAGQVSGDTQVLPFMDGMTRPTLLSKVDPQLSSEARNAGAGGTILTKCVITAAGTLQKCRIVKGNALVDQSVLTALAQWKYTPVLYQGKPTAVEYLIPVKLLAQ